MNEILECPACPDGHTYMEFHSLGMVCARCNEHTGNSHQGHFWSYCKVTRTIRSPHFCCPDNCELEATDAGAE